MLDEMYYGSPPSQSVQNKQEEDLMQIQMTPVVISGTCMGSVEMEPCGLGTTEQSGVSSYILETNVLCLDIQMM